MKFKGLFIANWVLFGVLVVAHSGATSAQGTSAVPPDTVKTLNVTPTYIWDAGNEENQDNPAYIYRWVDVLSFIDWVYRVDTLLPLPITPTENDTGDTRISVFKMHSDGEFNRTEVYICLLGNGNTACLSQDGEDNTGEGSATLSLESILNSETAIQVKGNSLVLQIQSWEWITDPWICRGTDGPECYSQFDSEVEIDLSKLYVTDEHEFIEFAKQVPMKQHFIPKKLEGPVPDIYF